MREHARGAMMVDIEAGRGRVARGLALCGKAGKEHDMSFTIEWLSGSVAEELREALLDEAAARESQRNVHAAVELAEVSCAAAKARCRRIRESGRYAIVRDVRIR